MSPATDDTTPVLPSPGSPLSIVRTLGALLDDLERSRIANGNRIGALTREHGSPMPHLELIQKSLHAAEHAAELELVRAWRKHPLAKWAKTYHGLGEKSIARLIALIGDPAERQNPSRLWAYCGVGDPARIRIPKGATQEELLARGKPSAKKQLYIIATSMLKTGNRAYYDSARAKYNEREWTDGHRHMAALRYAEKMFLLDLWKAARAL